MSRRTSQAIPRIFAVFGPPSSGVSTILDVLRSASSTPMAIIPYLGSESIPAIHEAMLHYNLIFLDVDGGMLSGQDIQDLVDERILSSGAGGVVRVHSDPEVCLGRAAGRIGYVTEDDLREWNDAILPVEDMIRTHSLKYYMVDSSGPLEDSVNSLAIRAKITS